MDEPVERHDPAAWFGAAEHVAAADVPGGQVGQRAATLVGVLDPLAARSAGRGRQRVADPSSRLDRRLLIGRDHAIAGVQQLAVPAACVEIEDPVGLQSEVGVGREDPRAVLPRTDRILRQPPQHGRARRVADAALDHQALDVSARAPRQRRALAGRLARHRIDLGDLLRGKSGAVDPTALDPQAPPTRVRRIFAATDLRPALTAPSARRSRRSSCPPRRTRRSSRAAHRGRPASASPRAPQARHVPHPSA
jgi:hypothetical protein